MARTVVIGFEAEAEARKAAANYSDTYRTMVIGPTDEVMVARGGQDGVTWRSGADADFWLMVATKGEVIGPGV